LEVATLVQYIPKSRGARHHADSISKALFLAKIMPRYAAAWAQDWAALLVDLVPEGVQVVACPPRSRRRIARHYFAGLLAEALAERLGLPLVLLRWAVEGRESSHHIATQRGKARARSRRAEVCDPEAVAGRRVLLTDDIVTTGLTLETCAAALTDAGAASVQCVCLAMTERTSADPARQDRLRQRAALEHWCASRSPSRSCWGRVSAARG
jgi:predicted amidophosphoribosyltransferase